MTTANAGGNNGEHAAPSRWFHRRESLISFALLLFAVAFNLYHLYPEVEGDVLAMNDNVFHLLSIEMAVDAITQGKNFTDPCRGRAPWTWVFPCSITTNTSHK